MKKAVSYITDVQILSNGIIEGCKCDCAVGEPPNAHCKHVVASLLAVEHMKRKRKIILNTTCTEKLQSFHKPKQQYFGTPLKAKDLPNVNSTHPINFKPVDPKTLNPEKYREKVRNMCINFISYTGSTMPFKQTIMPANTYAVTSDHGYANDPAEEILRSLKVSNVSDSDIEQIEKLTRDQDKSQQWREFRRHHLTASNFYSCCNSVSAEAKINLSERILNPTTFKSKQTQHGKDCEPKAIKLYEVLGVNVKKCGLILMKSNPFLGATPDGLIGDETVLEVKCPWNQRNSGISATSIPYLYEDVNKRLYLNPTHSYNYQIQGQLMVTGRKYATLLVYTFEEWLLIDIPRNDIFISEMLKKLKIFYQDYFKPALLDKYLYKKYAQCFYK